MINFKEELENFKPNLEVDNVEDNIEKNTIVDLKEILENLAKDNKKKE